jgi:hypothetical protein
MANATPVIVVDAAGDFEYAIEAQLVAQTSVVGRDEQCTGPVGKRWASPRPVQARVDVRAPAGQPRGDTQTEMQRDADRDEVVSRVELWQVEHLDAVGTR